jgi:hypothetical protein
MRKRDAKRMSLNRETLRTLEEPSLHQAAAASVAYTVCAKSACATCTLCSDCGGNTCLC